MSTIQNFEDLEIWKMARRQCQDFFSISNTSPLKRDFELKNQMNGSSGSVMDNIAEGFGRGGNIELKHFLVIAKGSNAEYRSQLYRCTDRSYIDTQNADVCLKLNEQISRKQMSFIAYLKTSEMKGVNRCK